MINKYGIILVGASFASEATPKAGEAGRARLSLALIIENNFAKNEFFIISFVKLSNLSRLFI